MNTKRNLQKALSAILVLMMVLSTMVIVPMTASAADWDGSVSTSLTGSGTEKDPYQIASAADFAYWAANGSGSYAVLTADITLSGQQWTSQSVSNIHLDGQNHKIIGLTIGTADAASAQSGIFSQLDGTNSLKNFTLSSAYVNTSHGQTGAMLVAAIKGAAFTMENVHIDATSTFKGTGTNHNGVFVGRFYGSATQATITNCSNSATATSAGHIGGIIGNVQYAGVNVTFTNCHNYSPLTSAKVAGGILGQAENGDKVTFINCSNEANITGATNVGGIIGGKPSGTLVLTDCSNSGAVTGNNLGGLLGYSNADTTMTNCTNTGNVANTNNAGGMVGYIGGAQNMTFISCVNAGTVNGSNAGGIYGYGSVGNQALTFKNCINMATGTITATGMAGGITAWSQANGGSTYVGCLNYATINGNNAGGILGYTTGKANLTMSYCINEGAVNASSSGAGILAYIATGTGHYKNTITYCLNTTAITAGRNAGGIIGYGTTLSDFIVDYCGNEGDITHTGAGAHIGGVIGYLARGGTGGKVQIHASYTNLYNLGDLIMDKSTGGNLQLGGLMARYETNYAAPYDVDGDGTAETRDILTFSNFYQKDVTMYITAASLAAQYSVTARAAVPQMPTENTCTFTNLVTYNTKVVTIDPENGNSTADVTTRYSGDTVVDTDTVSAPIAAIRALITAPTLNIAEGSGNLSIRIKLTDDFGLKAITSFQRGGSAVELSVADGFFSEYGFAFLASDTAVNAETVLASGTKVEGVAYNNSTTLFEASYTGVFAADLDEVIYFVAYAESASGVVVSEVRSINLLTLMREGANGSICGQVIENESEVVLYNKIVEYYEAYKAYLTSVTPA